MGIEIERKFLVDKEKWQAVAKPAGVLYRQGYLSDKDNPTIRVRVTDKQGFITLKGATSGISRPEFEYEIPATDATELLNSFALSEVEKTRYRIHHDNKLWEVDEFAGDNAGLIIAEIELRHEDEVFKLPEWITDEVSLDTRYYNSNLSINPYKSWNS